MTITPAQIEQLTALRTTMPATPGNVAFLRLLLETHTYRRHTTGPELAVVNAVNRILGKQEILPGHG